MTNPMSMLLLSMFLVLSGVVVVVHWPRGLGVMGSVDETGDYMDYYYDDYYEDQFENFIDSTKKTMSPIEQDYQRKYQKIFNEYSAERSLYSELFAPGRYLRNVRPLSNHSETMTIEIGVCISNIDEIIEMDQVMVTSGCLKMIWVDQFFQWKPESFGNLTWLAVPSTDIWIPDVAMTNSEEPYLLTRKKSFTSVRHNGSVGFYPSGRFRTRCTLSLRYFPFDRQRCKIMLESLIFRVERLRLVPLSDTPIDMNGYIDNQQWQLDAVTVETSEVYRDDSAYSAVVFTLTFSRKTLYYRAMAILPTFFMTTLQALSHTLPVEHPGRTTVLTALFLSVSLMQSGLASQLPKSSEGVSLIRKLPFFLITTIFCLFICLIFIRNPFDIFQRQPRHFHSLDFGQCKLGVKQSILKLKKNNN